MSRARSKDIGMSKGFTIFLGAAEVAGSLGVIFGVLTQNTTPTRFEDFGNELARAYQGV